VDDSAAFGDIKLFILSKEKGKDLSRKKQSPKEKIPKKRRKKWIQ